LPLACDHIVTAWITLYIAEFALGDPHFSIFEQELVMLYNGTDAFVYPSLYKGFGMPVLEPMACGTPVITSPFSSIVEVAGDAALLTDPNNPDVFAHAMIQTALDNTLRQRLIELGFEQARKFSWEKAAMETLNIYKECMRQ
jgi:glycosyltransferase involved in cell wall biosynthesis